MKNEVKKSPILNSGNSLQCTMKIMVNKVQLVSVRKEKSALGVVQAYKYTSIQIVRVFQN